jgi:hypothetical protein
MARSISVLKTCSCLSAIASLLAMPVFAAAFNVGAVQRAEKNGGKGKRDGR